MERVLRLNNTDQRITYGTSWTSIFDSRVSQNRFYSLTSTSGAELIFLFRGIFSHLMAYPLLVLIFMISDTGIPSQGPPSDFMAV